jgi:hypothetical protein
MLVTGHFGVSEVPLSVYVTSSADVMSYVLFILNALTPLQNAYAKCFVLPSVRDQQPEPQDG